MEKPLDVSAAVAKVLDEAMYQWLGLRWCPTCKDYLPSGHGHG